MNKDTFCPDPQETLFVPVVSHYALSDFLHECYMSHGLPWCLVEGFLTQALDHQVSWPKQQIKDFCKRTF